MTSTTSDSFASRLEDVLKAKGGFEPAMKRSFLIVALFEAKRCLGPRLRSMRPFECKIALMTTAIDLVYTLDFLTDEQKAGIVSLTVKNHAKPCIAKITHGAHREKQINEEVLPIIEKLLGEEEKTHEEICDEFVQKKYEENTGGMDAHPPLWEFRNMPPSFLIYRVYYRGSKMDPNIFAPIAPREVDVPAAKPHCLWKYAIRKASATDDVSKQILDAIAKRSGAKEVKDGQQGTKMNVAVDASNTENGKEGPMVTKNKAVGVKALPKMGPKKRLALIMEIKVRLELLKEMEGIFPDRRMSKEVKILFSALPPALTAGEVKNRQAAVMEAQLRVDLMKTMKGAIPSKKFANEMRKLYVGLPPLPCFGNGGSDSEAEGPKARKPAKEAQGENDKEDGWESVDDMKDVNAAVDTIEIA